MLIIGDEILNFLPFLWLYFFSIFLRWTILINNSSMLSESIVSYKHPLNLSSWKVFKKQCGIVKVWFFYHYLNHYWSPSMSKRYWEFNGAWFCSGCYDKMLTTNRNWSLTVMEAGKLTVSVLADLVSVESLPPGSTLLISLGAFSVEEVS